MRKDEQKYLRRTINQCILVHSAQNIKIFLNLLVTHSVKISLTIQELIVLEKTIVTCKSESKSYSIYFVTISLNGPEITSRN